MKAKWMCPKCHGIAEEGHWRGIVDPATVQAEVIWWFEHPCGWKSPMLPATEITYDPYRRWAERRRTPRAHALETNRKMG